MSGQLKDLSESHFCFELNTENHGVIDIDDERIEYRFVDFNGKKPPEEYSDGKDIPIISLKLENNNYATLMNSIVVRQTMSFPKIPSSTTIVPNKVIIGSDVWTGDHKVKSIYFTLWGLTEALSYSEYKETEFATGDDRSVMQMFDANKAEVCQFELSECSIQIIYSLATNSSNLGTEIVVNPMVFIEYKEEVDLDEALKKAYDLLTFFEFSTGRRTRLKDVRLRSGKSDEFPFTFRALFDVWAAPTLPSSDEILFPFNHSTNRENSTQALKAWMEADDDWWGAKTQLHGMLQYQEKLDEKSIIQLAAWFEEIPRTNLSSNVSKTDIDEICKAAYQKVQENDIDLDKSRLNSVLSILRNEGLGKRISESCSKVGACFDANWPYDEFVKKAKKFGAYRNKAAHSSLEIKREEFEEVYESMIAMKTLCSFLMLNLTDDKLTNASRLSRNPLFSFFSPWRLNEHKKRKAKEKQK